MRSANVLIILPILLGALVAPAVAGKKAGITMPDTIEVAGKKLVLNGMGLREATWLKVDVYVAGLYLEKVTSDPAVIINSDQTKRVVMRFKRKVDESDILKAWHDGFKNNAPVKLSKIQAEMDKLDEWMQRFHDGDTMTFTYVPGEGVYVDINKDRKGVLKGEDFARSLFSVWFGPKPPSGDLKKGMLGKH
jgi:hypothetical protein